MPRFPLNREHRKKNYRGAARSSVLCQRCQRLIDRAQQFLTGFAVNRHTCYVCGFDICDDCAERDLTQMDPLYSQYYCRAHEFESGEPYRADFYIPANFIGTTRGRGSAAPPDQWTYYFLSATEYGHITTYHGRARNAGRDIVQTRNQGIFWRYRLWRIDDRLHEPGHRSRGSLFLEATSPHMHEIQGWGGNWAVVPHDLHMVNEIIHRFLYLKEKYRGGTYNPVF